MHASKPSGRKTGHLNDVFVIGAGASVPYGFPTGANLLRFLREEKFSRKDKVLVDILDSVVGNDLKSRLKHEAFAEEEWDSSPELKLCLGWSRKVRGSVILTIDQFLRNLPDEMLRDLGKRLMARQILFAEHVACMPPSAKDGSMHSLDWIQELLTRIDLMENWSEYLKQTTFLTFNYDRVLEFFLHRYLVVDRNLSVDQAKDFVDSMNIQHLNGHLGNLWEIPFGHLRQEPFWRGEFDPLFDPSSTDHKAIDWVAVSKRMRTVWEDPEHHPDAAETQQKAIVAISKAQRIFVIGTSFIPENLDAIGLTRPSGPEDPKAWHAHFRATSKGLTEAQVQRAAQHLGIYPNLVVEHFVDMYARDFIIDFVHL